MTSVIDAVTVSRRTEFPSIELYFYSPHRARSAESKCDVYALTLDNRLSVARQNRVKRGFDKSQLDVPWLAMSTSNRLPRIRSQVICIDLAALNFRHRSGADLRCNRLGGQVRARADTNFTMNLPGYCAGRLTHESGLVK